jgi:hypothetical protein
VTSDVLVEVLAKHNEGRVHAFAVAIRAEDNLATRTLVDRDGRVREESFAARGLVLWREA